MGDASLIVKPLFGYGINIGTLEFKAGIGVPGTPFCIDLSRKG
jgi:hypothetical protein